MNNNQIIRRKLELQHLIESLCQKSAYLCVQHDVHNTPALAVAIHFAEQNPHYQSGYGLLYGLAYRAIKEAIIVAINASSFDRLTDRYGEDMVKEALQLVENENNA